MSTLSVLILTYNHKTFIAQAIESVLSQESDHLIDILILDDCSTDGAQEVIKKYTKDYPSKIKSILHSHNLGKKYGIQPCVYEGFIKLKGDYIAILEGDDYWTDPQKIQKQISFLDENKEFVACAHNTIKIYEDKKIESHRFIYSPNTPETLGIEDFISMTTFFHISSLVFRNLQSLKDTSFKRIEDRWCCDIFFNMVHTQFGKLHYINEDMAAYRAHSGSNFSSWPELKGRIFNIEGHRRFNYWLKYKYLKEFSFAIYRLCREMLVLSELGKLPRLPLVQQLKYKMLEIGYAKIYDFINFFPKLDPAVWWYKKPVKNSELRKIKIKGYDSQF